MLTCLAWENQVDWDISLPAATYALNASLHSTHNVPPYTIIFGRSPPLPVDVQLLESQEEPLFDWISKIQQTQLKALETAVKFKAQRDKQRMKYRPQERNSADVVPGDVVFWRKPLVTQGQGLRTKKFFGPYLVVQRNGSKAQIRLLETGKVHPLWINVEQLKRAPRYKLDTTLQHSTPNETLAYLYKPDDSEQS